ncbi:gamma-glutamyl kinase [Leisingera sp. M527]|uniref:gamma-glutamyl kinase n=1 Tax=unclassified Leisingera TaxID=2614906 RepID=UPI0021A6BB67|nr:MULTISPECIES: gamma-glutamyl kinase [unclassified Leisingera]UWQ30615.1 gamma-glutamyl kinase [Leisingera sp. M523]UWQ34759.1 gamma-glutamyl kinase [Leisingera sp. M527]UWQ76718.1 gamma-glutamyl kinase [Leisingera sp. M658]
MMIFFKERLALLSVPKTGTTAFQAALRNRADLVVSDPPELKHAPLYRYNRWIRPMFEKVCGAELEVAAVMREPVSWLGSWYRYRQRPALDGNPNSTKDVSFDDFLHAYCKGKPPAFANVGSQAKFLEAQPNGCKVSHLFRYEDQDALKQFLELRLDVEIRLERKNVSPQASLTLSPEAQNHVRRKRAAEFELYDSIPVR